MNFLLLCTMLVLGKTIGSDYNYDNFRICKKVINPNTDKAILECKCENRENFTLDAIYDFTISEIIIKGCGDVQIPFASINNLNLDEIEFADIDNLTILPFALSSVQGVSILKISDVAELNIIPHAFVGLYNVDQFIIRNVTATKLTKDAFSAISAVNQFLIEDCVFHEVQQYAFAIQNVTFFYAINTSFYTMENYSLLLHNAKEAVFESCVFHETENGSFVYSFVDSVYYKNCFFSEIETTAFHSNPLNVFSITDSHIENLKPDAFGALVLQHIFVFTDNTIDITYETSFSSLLYPQAEELDMNYCCNSFTCDCNIFWMWGLKDIDKNNTMLETSFCTGRKEKPVTFYKPVIDSYNNCMTLELKSPPKTESREAKKIITECLNNECPLNEIPSFGQRLTFELWIAFFTLIFIALL